MNIAIIGYGKMGHEIEAIARQRGHTIDLIIDLENSASLNAENLAKVDVAIEFSNPSAALNNILTCLNAKTPVVAGTTGWLDNWSEVEKACTENDAAFFYASNYSIGVNILFAINRNLAEIMNDFPEYDVSINEIHYVHKLYAPSGTAISLADQISKELKRKDRWSLEQANKENIWIKAEREGEVNGYHEVIYDSDIDTISISHSAKSRKGFATGAVLAAEYLPGKKGIHSMKELLNI